MTPFERAGYLAQARTPGFERRVQEAERIIREGLSRASLPYVACSFGKDSAVMLHLVLQQCLGVPVRMTRWSETSLLNDFEPVLAAWQERFGVIPEFCDLTRDSIEAVVPSRHRALAALGETNGYFLGLRAEESKGRRMALRKYGPVYQTVSRLWRIAPLAWWRWQDVAAYTVKHDLPVLASYGATGLEGRTATRVGIQAHGIRDAQLAELRRRDPAAYNRLCLMLPEVAEWI